MKKVYLLSTLSIFSALGLSNPSLAAVITFDDQGLIGPASFVAAGNAQTLKITGTPAGDVLFRGGVILSNATNTPANRSTVYGTANNTGASDLPDNPTRQNPLTIEFGTPVQNVFLDLLNGVPANKPISYTIADDIGNTSTFALASNTDSSFQTIGLATTGQKITIAADTSHGAATPFPDGIYDFFIDNITFNTALPNDLPAPIDNKAIALQPAPEPTPEPTTTPELQPSPILATRSETEAQPNLEPVPIPTPPKANSPKSVLEPTSIIGLITISMLSLLTKRTH